MLERFNVRSRKLCPRYLGSQVLTMASIGTVGCDCRPGFCRIEEVPAARL